MSISIPTFYICYGRKNSKLLVPSQIPVNPNVRDVMAASSLKIFGPQKPVEVCFSPNAFVPLIERIGRHSSHTCKISFMHNKV